MTKSRDIADSINRIDSSAADATAMTIDASENVGIGTAPSTKLDVLSSGAVVARFKRDNTGGASGGISVGNNDKLFTFYVDNSGGLQFYEDSTERIRFQLGGGISFNGDTAAANALDDYEEGTWTPVVAQGWTSVTFPNSYQNGNYVKVGNLVTAWFYLQFSGTNASQHVRISGLPFNSPNEPAGAFRGGAVTYFNIPVNSTGMILAYVAHNNNYIEFYSGNDAATSTNSNANASGDYLIGSVTYRAS